MGWDITLTTDKDVTEADMDEIVSGLPEWMRGPFYSKQSWGYSLSTDVRLESPRKVRCSGSCSISGKIAEEFCREFAQMLKRQVGGRVRVGKMSV
jgi:hypothetical protein